MSEFVERGGTIDEPHAVIMMKNGQFAAGIIQHPQTDMWQSWFSFFVGDLTCMTAHTERSDAERVVRIFVQGWKNGQLKDLQSTSELISSLPTDAPPSNLPSTVQFGVGQWIKGSRNFTQG